MISITITRERLRELLDAENTLNALMAAGVHDTDVWGEYEETEVTEADIDKEAII
jgi:hypothetical protein